MASTFTPLGIELQATGENAGTWGTKTNTNLELIEQIAGGFTAQSIAGGAQTTALSVSDGSTGAVMAHRMIDFTGTITGNQIVTIPLDVQNFYILRNSTSGAYTVQFKYASGSGSTFTFSATNKKTAIVFATANDGTNPDIIEVQTGGDVVDDTSPQLGGDLDTNSFNISFDDAHGITDENGNEQIIFQTTSSAVNQIDITNAATSNAPSIQATGGDSNINLKVGPKGTGLFEVMGATNPGSVQLNCESNSHGIKLTSPPHSAGQSYELKFPTGNVTANRFLKVDSVSGSGTTGVGQLSFAEVSGGTSWQAVKTSNFNAAAGEGYFVNTSSGAVTATLPASPSIGDTFEFKDYGQSFGTNALNIDPNGNPFEGLADTLHQARQNRQSIVITYVDSTKGYVLTGSSNSTASSNSGLFNVLPEQYSVSFLCIAGGGGGGGSHGGGAGGAGGYRSSYNSEASGGGGSAETALSLTKQTQYTITVGAGTSSSGADSSISGSDITTLTSAGGGASATDGGSGGGGRGTSPTSGGSGTANQGKDGGNGSGGNSYRTGGGGGGAANAGGNGAEQGNAGAGGNGVASTITGSSVTRAGGGGGGAQQGGSTSAANGGTGGGGNGHKGSSANAGTANTGGGGGGNQHGGAQGGSGVVILRMATSNYSGTTTGSPTVTTSGSDTILVYNSSGTYTG